MFERYTGEAWEARFLPRLTYQEIAALPKEDALVILPIGAIEQHGPHMPVMTDALIGEAVLTHALDQLDEEGNIWLLPPLAYGKSNEHLDFPGTISLSASTLQGVVTDIATSVAKAGFRRLVLFNTHGGNTDLLNVAARELRISTGLMVFFLSPSSLNAAHDLLSDEEKEYGIHAGDYETSLVMAIKPAWVHTDKLVREIPDLSGLRYLTLEGKTRFAWVMSDISSSGAMGDSTQATSAKGDLILSRCATTLALALKELATFEISTVRSAPREEMAVRDA
ncbi:creatininase family protein [Paenibacillus daejeonensis]|uniref:creatininase family protein n=1 Tax=Paenibacillus daejeonensis TaxID=135193 RepID=UPI00036EBE92|nr:creatininase family protein [Paenibacillus daejeonensis]